MQVIVRSIIIACLALGGSWAWSDNSPKPELIGASWVYSTQGQYHNVKSDLVAAIEATGMVISYTAHAASMLVRTADAVGAAGTVYDNADILLFCKADLTYELTAANPHNLTLCPYSIAIYTLAKDKDTVYLSIRDPAINIPEYASIHSLLESIIANTLEW